MSKSVNLDSVVQIIDSGDNNLLKSFLKLEDNGFSYTRNSGMSGTEIDDLLLLSKYLIAQTCFSQKNGYFIGYVVNAGIREEFDILRFSNDTIVNIELKHDLPSGSYEEINDQLIRHRYLLSILEKRTVLCTFINSLNKLLLLKEDNTLVEVSFESLANMIPYDYILKNELENINLSSLIISPYSQPAQFANHQYFLTDEQKEVRKDILTNNQYNKFGLIGGPGTGKSMVIIDLAKEYQRLGRKVLVIFCASLPNSNEISTALDLNILSIKNITENVLNAHNIILVDEAQRLYKNQYDWLMNTNNKKVIFSVDHQQTLHPEEKKLYIENQLKLSPDIKIKELKKKVRTDLVMSSFIQKFLNLKAKGVQPFDYDNVNVVYFENKLDAGTYIEYMRQEENYVSIELTEYVTKTGNNLKRPKICMSSETSHSVIGKEYDNVLVPLDKYFKYDEDAKLVSTYNEYYPYYEDSCIFEALTRVKNKLLLVIIDNPDLYITVQEILTWKNDKLYKQ
ncbi:hypothetical protein A5821_002743 [Enterococcus sp. 7F3_DIV0205]|uniref:AAA+ ATPase domain-containing protein n=1 Tax=Candidatus Enterococcus palustris TaxID=1834189 RepID=A0AAQ3WCU3_9ENTE|nr:DNA/RNA helicase domain-containing protein [Enterococcus sp. 7F3_DIV0205]OTN83177.1 hypothetical protein A5821_003100 [Enterococcus sp. 7F3_DIV0205]